MTFIARLWGAATGAPLVWVLLAALGAGFYTGWVAGRMPLHTQLAEADAAQSKERLRTAERATQVLQAAQLRSDELTQMLATQQTQIDKSKKERLDAIHQVTTGRTCLDSASLRLLNGAPGLRVSGFATAGSSPVATRGATAADPDSQSGLISTDDDVATWDLVAGARFEVCRIRLDALIDWFGPPPPQPKAP
jgi:hypothetical protein